MLLVIVGYSAVLRAGNLKLRSGEAQAADEFSRTEGGFSRFNFDVNHVSKLSKVTQFYIFCTWTASKPQSRQQ